MMRWPHWNAPASVKSSLSLAWRAAYRSVSLRLLIGGGLLAGVLVHFRVIDRLAAGSVNMHGGWLSLGVASTFLLIATRAFRWNLVVGSLGSRLNWCELVSIYGASFFLGLVSPAKLGEVSRAWWVRKKVPGLHVAALSVAFDRALDMPPMFLLVGLFGALVIAPEDSQAMDTVRLALAGLSLLILYLLFRQEFFFKLVGRITQKIAARIAHRHASAPPVLTAMPPAVVVKAVALSVASQCVAVMQMYCFARCVDIDVDPVTLYAVVSIATMVSWLPITIAGMGTREAAVVAALAGLGVAADEGVAFALAWLLNFVVMLLAFGLVFVIRTMTVGTGDRPPTYDSKPVGTSRGGNP